MVSCARAVLTQFKTGHHEFDDRVLLLDVPAKIGRSHKEDQADSSNAFFDCKVLSKQHALLLYEDVDGDGGGQFRLADVGSSNGTFVNNVRLSRAGEQSEEPTRLYTGDLLRFGSDVTDRARKVTQKCVVCKVLLLHPDGREEPPRPPESRLFRPTAAAAESASLDDLQEVTRTLREALAREKALEDKLVKVRNMLDRDEEDDEEGLSRTLEEVRRELKRVYSSGESSNNGDDPPSSPPVPPRPTRRGQQAEALMEQVSSLKKSVENLEEANERLTAQAQQDAVEITTLKKVCDLQKRDLEEMETRLKDAQDETRRVRLDGDQRLSDKTGQLERENRETVERYTAQLQEQEELFAEERSKIREQLHEVTANEQSLLNRIKCLEAEEGYSHAEVERILVREREMTEELQAAKLGADTLKRELAEERAGREALEREVQELERARSSGDVRSPQDVAALAELESRLAAAASEAARLRHELIEARARKSASDDGLDAARGKVQTLENTVAALSEEGVALRKTIEELRLGVEERTREADHLRELVASMEEAAARAEAEESENGVGAEVLRAQIEDLRTELATAEALAKQRSSEVESLCRDLKSRDEEIQQREIDLSCLRGQVQDLKEECDCLRAEDEAASFDRRELLSTKQAASEATARAAAAEEEARTATERMERQETLYAELKKMRGVGEEMEHMQQLQQDLRNYQELTENLRRRLASQEETLGALADDKTRLLREVTRLTASSTPSATAAAHLSAVSAGSAVAAPGAAQAAMASVGSLKTYEVALAAFFVYFMVTYFWL